MLSGCDKTSSSNCSSELAHKSLSQQIIEQVTKLTADEKYSDKDEYIFEKSKIRATVDQIKIVVEDVRTTEKDPNSSQQFCSGTLKITVPTNVLSDADQARELENRPKISQDARRGDIDDNLNVFTKKDFTFNIQPTDDGDKLYVKSEGAGVIEDFLHRVVASALWKPELEKRKAQMDIQKAAQSQQTQQEKQNIENLKHEAETSKLETERLMAEQEKQEAENLKKELLEKQTTQSQQEQQEAENLKIELLEKQTATSSIQPTPDKSDNQDQTTLSQISPSFNCAKASTKAERLICSNNELAGYDVQLAKLYKTVMATTTDKTALKTEQRNWNKNVRDACADVICMLHEYNIRIRQLSTR
jgi:hypothetical protein